MVGTNAYISSETGRFANLIRCNPATTRSDKVPIVTAYLKVEASDSIPFLLKLNEAVYNAGSPMTLLSEYQIREHGYTIDPVANKHRIFFDTYRTQKLVLNGTVHIPFVDRGGLIDFEMLSIKDSDMDHS